MVLLKQKHPFANKIYGKGQEPSAMLPDGAAITEGASCTILFKCETFE